MSGAGMEWNAGWLALRKGTLMLWDRSLQHIVVMNENLGGPGNWALQTHIATPGGAMSFDGEVLLHGTNTIIPVERNGSSWRPAPALDTAGFSTATPLVHAVEGTVAAVCGISGTAPDDRVLLRIFERGPADTGTWIKSRDTFLTTAAGGTAGPVGVNRGVIVAGFREASQDRMKILRRQSAGIWKEEQTIEASGPLTIDRGAFIANGQVWARTQAGGGSPWRRVSFLDSNWTGMDICRGVMAGVDRPLNNALGGSPAGFIAAPGVRCSVVDDEVHRLQTQPVSVSEGVNTVALAKLRVSITWPVNFPTYISWHTEDDTATAGSDYFAASGVAVIHPGTTGSGYSGRHPGRSGFSVRAIQGCPGKPGLRRHGNPEVEYHQHRGWRAEFLLSLHSLYFSGASDGSAIVSHPSPAPAPSPVAR